MDAGSPPGLAPRRESAPSPHSASGKQQRASCGCTAASAANQARAAAGAGSQHASASSQQQSAPTAHRGSWTADAMSGRISMLIANRYGAQHSGGRRTCSFTLPPWWPLRRCMRQ